MVIWHYGKKWMMIEKGKRNHGVAKNVWWELNKVKLVNRMEKWHEARYEIIVWCDCMGGVFFTSTATIAGFFYIMYCPSLCYIDVKKKNSMEQYNDWIFFHSTARYEGTNDFSILFSLYLLYQPTPASSYTRLCVNLSPLSHQWEVSR